MWSCVARRGALLRPAARPTVAQLRALSTQPKLTTHYKKLDRSADPRWAEADMESKVTLDGVAMPNLRAACRELWQLRP